MIRLSKTERRALSDLFISIESSLQMVDRAVAALEDAAPDTVPGNTLAAAADVMRPVSFATNVVDWHQQQLTDDIEKVKRELGLPSLYDEDEPAGTVGAT